MRERERKTTLRENGARGSTRPKTRSAHRSSTFIESRRNSHSSQLSSTSTPAYSLNDNEREVISISARTSLPLPRSLLIALLLLLLLQKVDERLRHRQEVRLALRLRALGGPVDDRLVREDVGAVQDLRCEGSSACAGRGKGRERTLRILGKAVMTLVFSYAQIWIVLLSFPAQSAHAFVRRERRHSHQRDLGRRLLAEDLQDRSDTLCTSRTIS